MNNTAKILFKKAKKLESSGHNADAINAYEMALKESPNDPEILFALGNVAKKLNLLPIAEEMFRATYGLLPSSIEAATNLAVTINDQERTEEAIEIYKSILVSHPEHEGTWVNIGVAVASTGDLDNAEIFYREALRLKPNSISALTNLSELLAQNGDFEGALKLIDKALKRDKRNAIIRYNRGELLLTVGRLKEGWFELDYGAQNRKDRQNIYHHTLKRWNGEDLSGKKILLSCEQGIGDQVRYLNCVDDIIEQAEHVFIETEPRLVNIISRTYPKATVKALDHKKIANQSHFYYDWPVNDLDYASSMLHLYGYLKPDIESFSQKSRLLVTDQKLDQKWQTKIDKISNGLKVGICWRSAQRSLSRDMHYLDIMDWGPILTQENVTFFSLMYDQCDQEIKEVLEKFGVDIINFSELDYKNDIDQVFSLTKQMDVVISVNSAPASFSGVLGIPTYIPSQLKAWNMLGTDHMVMVPAMKPIIQQERGNWKPVIDELAVILKSYHC